MSEQAGQLVEAVSVFKVRDGSHAADGPEAQHARRAKTPAARRPALLSLEQQEPEIA
jgi:hypothetical protein